MAKKLTPKGVFTLLKNSFNGFIDDKVLKLSAALAYYTVFSIGPMIIIIIYFAGVIYGQDAVQGSVFNEIKGLVGAEAALQIQDMIKNAALSNKGSFAAIIGFVTLLIGATDIGRTNVNSNPKLSEHKQGRRDHRTNHNVPGFDHRIRQHFEDDGKQ